MPVKYYCRNCGSGFWTAELLAAAKPLCPACATAVAPVPSPSKASKRRKRGPKR